MNRGGSEKPDSCLCHYCQGHQSCPSGGDKCSTPSETIPNTLEILDEIQGIQQNKMTVGQRKKLFFQQLDLSDLDKWSDQNQAAAQTLLAEDNNIFSCNLES